MKNKSVTIKRIILFCVLAVVPLCIAVPILNHAYDAPIFTSEKGVTAAYVLGVFGMFAPLLAAVLTRLITKEGFSDSYLGLNCKGNLRYYLAAVLVKPAEALIAMLLICAVLLKLPLADAFSDEQIGQKVAAVLVQFGTSIILFFPAFGEEWGWRGYLMPKLMQVMNKPAAIVVGGLIWGLWHAPLTVSGHNFGVDYKGSPWLGILFMCVLCILMNAFLTLMTERTKSIYPASFCHMINNNLSPMILLGIFGSESALMKCIEVAQIRLFALMLPPIAVTAIISFCLLLRKK